ncbi:hypothetical protein P9112_000114 [Eukaryota sp. TZLM1-RC]
MNFFLPLSIVFNFFASFAVPVGCIMDVDVSPDDWDDDASFKCRSISFVFSDIAKPTLDTVDKFKKLHPEENFVCPKPNICEFWTNNPINASEVPALIKKLPNGKAAGLSGISLDISKTACDKTPEIADDLAFYFQQLVSLKVVPPPELTATRLIAFMKPGSDTKPSGISPIAVHTMAYSHHQFTRYIPLKRLP